MSKQLIAYLMLSISLSQPIQGRAVEHNFDIENIDFASGEHQIVNINVNNGVGKNKIQFSGKVQNSNEPTRSAVFSLCRGLRPQQIMLSLVKQTNMESTATADGRITGADDFLLFASENNLQADVLNVHKNKQVVFLRDNKHLFILDEPVETSQLPTCN